MVGDHLIVDSDIDQVVGVKAVVLVDVYTVVAVAQRENDARLEAQLRLGRIIPKGYVVMVVKVLPQNHYLLINVSSTNSEQSKLCINGPLYIDAWLLWKQE